METPLDASVSLISFKITANGADIPDIYSVHSILVIKEINKIPHAEIKILDGEPAKQDFPASGSKFFIPGTEIVVEAGYNNKTKKIFEGVIIKHGIQFKNEGRSMLELECKSRAVKMTANRKNRFFAKSTDSDAISTIFNDYSADVKSTLSSTSVEHKELVQYYTTDWDFVVTRAEMNGMVVLADDAGVKIEAPDVSSTPVLSLTYGRDIMEFQAEIDAKSQISAVTSSGWDIESQALEQSTSSSPSVNIQGNISSSDLAKVMGVEQFNLQTSGPVQEADLKAWANAQLLKSWMSRIRGKCKFQGNASPVIGSQVKLSGVGARFNGNAYVSKVTHDISCGNWHTDVVFGLSPEWFMEKTANTQAPPASGMIAGVSGLKIGKVQKIDEDPDNEYRVQVNIPIMQNSNESIWARLSSNYATKEAGIFFYPEIGDEVIVGFLNQDPRYPIILGSLHSSTLSPHSEPDGENSIKEIVTSSQCKISFDDAQKIITITTPGGNMATLDDASGVVTIKDQNNNQIEMSSSGIDVKSASNLTISAQGNIDISASGNLDLSAKSNLNVSGLAIANSAQTSFSAKGQASAELSASGTTTVKGAMVMIN